MLLSSKFDWSEDSWEKVLEGGCSERVYKCARIRYVLFSTTMIYEIEANVEIITECLEIFASLFVDF